MEQATNQFNKGLLMDTNPMMLGEQSLSNALNATFITMNGSEVILQNDMGNRRIDNAYLPAGYQPLGMKEYGGIIYVAAYNPITNRSLIGSFPSPERKRGSEYQDLKGNLNLNEFTASNNITTEDGINFIKADTILVRLTGDTSLHAGDKFSVYCDYSSIPTLEITNFNNVSEGKVTSPKNKKYTLSLGILNSLNEFVDITKMLQRWDSNNTIIDNLLEKSNLYKFNIGYFIAPSKPLGVNYSDLTKNDKLFLEERLKIAINTYAYKLVGPLYLKAELNHIQNASYNIYGIKENNLVTLWVEALITYNCPDGAFGGEGDDNYSTYDLGTPNFTGFDFIGLNTNLNLISTKYSNHSYNPETNLYTVTILKEYNCTNPSNNIINYYFCVPAINNIYLKGLSEKGSIDTSLLGSGQIDLTGWRFYNNNKQTTLTYNLSAYPKYGSSFSDLTFTFINVNNSSNRKTLNAGTIFNGKNTLQFNWNEDFLERSLYTVEINYNEIINGLSTAKSILSNKWFLTTELFNDCYRPSHPDYMADFSASENEYIREKYCTIEMEVTPSVKNLSPIKEVTNNGGKLLSKQPDINILYIHSQQIELLASTSVKIKNEELYPNYLSISKYPTYEVQCDANIESVEELLEFKDSKIDNMIEIAEDLLATYNNNIINISGLIKYYDKYMSLGKSAGNLSITNGFTTISDAIEKLVNLTKSYTGLFLDMESHYGGDKHYVWAITNDSEIFGHRSVNDGSDPPGDVTNIFYEHDDGMKATTVSENYLKITQVFNKSDMLDVFIFLGIGKGLGVGSESEHAYMSNQRMVYHGDDNTAKKNPYARIWWRTANLNYPWALLEIPWTNVPTTGSSRDGLILTIKAHFINPDNIYICFYKNYSLQGFYIPNVNNENYNYEYNLILPINIEMSEKTKASISGNKGPLTFTVSNIKDSLTITVNDIVLDSSKTFQNIVSNSSNIPTSNITIDSGIGTDSNGGELSVNSVYIEKEEGLVENKNSLITPNSSEYGGQYYGFLYGKSNTYTIGSPSASNGSYMYDTYGEDGDSFTSLSYASINIVKKDSING